MSRHLIILLHGVGSRGADIAPLAGPWNHKLPVVEFAAPDAPHPFGYGPGRQWFSVQGVTETNRPERVAAARARFDQTLHEVIDEHGMTIQLDRVALVGFSALLQTLSPCAGVGSAGGEARDVGLQGATLRG